MNRYLLGRVVLCAIALAPFLSNAEQRLTKETAAFEHRFTPCNSWTYDARGFAVCRSVGYQITVPDNNEYERKIRDLENRISRLEQELP